MKGFILGLGIAAILIWSLLLRKSAPIVPSPITVSEEPGAVEAAPAYKPPETPVAAQKPIKTDDQPKGAKMFQDPDMKEVLTGEAKSAAVRSANALFEAGLGRYLTLDEQQSALLKDLLTQRASIVWDQILVPMATGELTETGMAAAGREVKNGLAANTDQIRALLGSEGFEVYQWYEKTQPDRERVNQLKPQFEKAGQALTAEQQTQLLTLLIEERPAFRWQYDFADPQNIDYERWHDYFNEQNFSVYFEEMKQFHDHITQRAQTVLTPEQTTLLATLLKQHVQKSKFTVRTTMALMGQKR